ncbi:hypothetical protein ColLi_13246 [Colletotrichum liriopes]|uniref:Uncharacterized protein n=1 Tax=Colletotrichum liriopes TaxID=708192 RepID=A0AA37GZV3_9PEZI|nr:hypothetical protein ColLi_13246 [Colletotrichum liriopes]
MAAVKVRLWHDLLQPSQPSVFQRPAGAVVGDVQIEVQRFHVAFLASAAEQLQEEHGRLLAEAVQMEAGRAKKQEFQDAVATIITHSRTKSPQKNGPEDESIVTHKARVLGMLKSAAELTQDILSAIAPTTSSSTTIQDASSPLSFTFFKWINIGVCIGRRVFSLCRDITHADRERLAFDYDGEAKFACQAA